MGHWKNYEDLESNLSMEELISTLNAMREKENREHKFLAAIQGIDLDSAAEEAEQDITDLKGWKAEKEGFGVGMGLGYVVQGG